MPSVSIRFQHATEPAFSTSNEATVSSLRTLCESFRGDVADEYFTPVEVLRGWLVEAGVTENVLGDEEDASMVTVAFD